MAGIVGKLLFGFVFTLAAVFALLILVGLLAALLAPLLGSVPIYYNLRSIKARWTSAIVAVLGIAGTVGVFVAMLSLANGFKATLVASGSRGNALILRADLPFRPSSISSRLPASRPFCCWFPKRCRAR